MTEGKKLCRCKRANKKRGALFCAQCLEEYRPLWERP